MEGIRAIADAHYRAGTEQLRGLAYDFFRKLDGDGDGLVSLHEFLSFMSHEGYTRLARPSLFKDLDRDGNGYLDFWEVLTLYYIIKSERPVCDCCWILIPGTFFSCVECFSRPGGSYSLCIDCYRSKKSNHYHAGRQQFLDTFTLLQTRKPPPPPLPNHIYQCRDQRGPPRFILASQWLGPMTVVVLVALQSRFKFIAASKLYQTSCCPTSSQLQLQPARQQQRG